MMAKLHASVTSEVAHSNASCVAADSSGKGDGERRAAKVTPVEDGGVVVVETLRLGPLEKGFPSKR